MYMFDTTETFIFLNWLLISIQLLLYVTPHVYIVYGMLYSKPIHTIKSRHNIATNKITSLELMCISINKLFTQNRNAQ